MSSAIAMNRKIAAQGGIQNEEQKSVTQQRPALTGTPVQQQWQVLNYHETRLNKMDAFLTRHSKENANGFNNVNLSLGTLHSHIKQLETSLADLNKELESLKNKSDTKTDVRSNTKVSKNNKRGSVQLEIEKN